MVVGTPELVHSHDFGGFFLQLVEKVAEIAEFTPIFTPIHLIAGLKLRC